MAELNLGKQYDAIISLFSAIGYLTAPGELAAALKAMAEHLKPGGVVVIEPWFTKEAFTAGHIHMTTYDGPDVKIARMGESSIRDGNISVMDMHYMVLEKGKGVHTWVDSNILALMENLEDIVTLLVQHGVEAHIEEADFTIRKLIVGVKRLM